MIAIPIVKSFLGCVDLKNACLIIAAFRLVVSIITLVVLLLVFVILEDETVEASNQAEAIKKIETSNDAEASDNVETNKPAEPSFSLIEFLIAVYVTIAAVIVTINVITTYWFIQGVTSNKPAKMKYYLWLEIAIIVLLILSFRLVSLIAVPVECYIFICSNSLYQEYLLGNYNEHVDEATENTAIKYDNVQPPATLYNSSDEHTQLTQPQTTNPFKE